MSILFEKVETIIFEDNQHMEVILPALRTVSAVKKKMNLNSI